MKRKIPPRKVDYVDYSDYLKSEKWEKVRGEYRQKEDTQNCLCCAEEFGFGLNPNYHHFKYPKDWNNDTYENLIIVCGECHSILHNEIDHNSDPISLREYLIKMIPIITGISGERLRSSYCDSLWRGTAGDFVIAQHGMSKKKTMTFTAKIDSQNLIEYFEKERDEHLPKGGDNV